MVSSYTPLLSRGQCDTPFEDRLWPSLISNHSRPTGLATTRAPLPPCESTERCGPRLRFKMWKRAANAPRPMFTCWGPQDVVMRYDMRLNNSSAITIGSSRLLPVSFFSVDRNPSLFEYRNISI